MIKILQPNKQLFLLTIPFSIILFLVFFSQTQIFIKSPSEFSLAITIDLLLSVPIIYYLIIRKTKIPKTTVVPVLIAGVIVGTYTLPHENQYHLSLFKTWILPMIEVSVLTLIIIKVYASLKKYKEKKETNPDFFTALKETCSELIPRTLVPFVATEIAVIYYGFIKWKKLDLKENEFSYHKNSGSSALFGVIIFILAVETIALHFLIAMWNNTIAWILSALSIYLAIQFFGYLKSLSQRPFQIENNCLILRYGILAETEIDFQDMESIELSTNPIESDNLTRKLSILGDLESHNVIIKLNKENVISNLYGSRKKFTTLAFFVNNEDKFKNKVDTILQHKKV